MNAEAIRAVELFIARDYHKQEMRCPVHLSVGAESVAADVCKHLRSEDLVLAHHRCHAPYLAKGGAVQKLMDELHGLPAGCTRGRGGSMHLSDLDAGFIAAIPVVGAVLPIAAGVALAEKGTGNVVAVFVGDGALETGVFWETLNLVRLLELPLLISIEDNALSVETPALERRSDFWMPAYQVDPETAVAMARNGVPTILLAGVERLCEHCGPRVDL